MTSPFAAPTPPAYRTTQERVVAQLRQAILSGQLPRGRLVTGGLLPLGIGMHDRAELAVAAAEGPGPVLIGVHRAIGQIALQLRMLAGQVGKPLKHCCPPAILAAAARTADGERAEPGYPPDGR